MHLSQGTSLQGGKYIIEKVLGQGGFGITYLAKDVAHGTYVAVKEFFFQEYCERNTAVSTAVSVPSEGQRELVKRFETKFIKEAKLLAAISHSGVVRVLDVFAENDTSYYAMEYVEGRTISEIVAERGKLSSAEAAKVAEAVADALEYLHVRSINHLDIKPSNILVENGSGRVVLIDFGVSKQYDPATGDSTTTTPLGVSAGYSPMEQYNKEGLKKFSPASDIYSLGATLYKMITGQTPPSAIDVAQHGMLPLTPDVPVGVRNAVSAAMRAVPADRPSSVAEFRKLLHSTAPMAPQSDPNRTVLVDDTTHRSKVWVGAVAAVIGLAVVVMIFAMRNSGFDDTAAAEEMEDSTWLEVVEETPVEEDSFTTERFSRRNGKSALEIDFPTSGNEILLRNIREWINGQLGDKYEGSLEDGQALFDFYASKLPYGSEDVGSDGYEVTRLHKGYEDDVIITYVNDNEWYGGGAHGAESTVGVTFRKSDGKVFTSDYVTGSSDGFRDLLVRGLKGYFNFYSDQELLETLQLSNVPFGETPTISQIPLPTVNPWITDRGVHFYYTEYEIACYADGTPNFVVSRSEIMPYITATGKTFFN